MDWDEFRRWQQQLEEKHERTARRGDALYGGFMLAITVLLVWTLYRMEVITRLFTMCTSRLE